MRHETTRLLKELHMYKLGLQKLTIN